jgi:antitoxin component of MazEF toxin-antitoxin module
MGRPRRGRSKFQVHEIYVAKYNYTISVPIYYEKKGNELGVFVSEPISAPVSATKVIQFSGFRSKSLSDFETHFHKCVEEQTQEELNFKPYELIATTDIMPNLSITDFFARGYSNDLSALYRLLGINILRYLAVNSEGVVYSSGNGVNANHVQQVQLNMSNYRLLTDAEKERKTTELLDLVRQHTANLEKIHEKFKENVSKVISNKPNTSKVTENSPLSDLLKKYY